MQELMIVDKNLPIAIKNAIPKYGLTVEQAENLAFAIKEADMNPSRAMGFLKKISPETLAGALMIRAHYDHDSPPPSVPKIAKAMDLTNFPTDRTPSEYDYDAVYHTIRNYQFRRERTKYNRDPFDGGFNRAHYHHGLEGSDVYTWENDDRQYCSEADIDRADEQANLTLCDMMDPVMLYG
jgi:hypothetical protein